MTKKVRDYCFTKFEKHGKDKPVFEPKRMKCLFFAPEYTKEEKFHWQGYVYWKNQRTKSAMIKDGLFGDIRSADGTAQQNVTYIQGPYHKDDKDKPFNPKYEFFGKLPVQGERGDLNDIKRSIENGESVDTICMDEPMIYHKYGRTLHKIEDIVLRKKHRTKMTECDWLWGATGVGKSHEAFKNYDSTTHYVWKNDNGWQDDYVGQKIVIINDFRGEIKYGELLQLIDKWPYTLRRRGRSPVPFLAEKIIITACSRPEDIYSGVAQYDRMDQLLRRVKVREIKKSIFAFPAVPAEVN